MRETDLISVAEAIAVLDAVAVSPRVVEKELSLARGFRLAQDIVADRDYPPFDKSVMDGYAVRSADQGARAIVGEISAGQTASRALNSGEAMAIMTGAALPVHADAVVPVEDCQVEGQRLRFDAKPKVGANIALRGSDCPANEVVLRKGTKLEAAQLAVAASVGAAKVRVFAAPRAAVLSTGDELVSIDAVPGPVQIRNSNNIMLSALLWRMGCDVTDLGVARDQPEVIRDAIQKGLQFDLLIVSGGMSMGRYDFVPKILQELGVELKITKLRIKPGKPFVFGIKSESGPYIFGLPGNPVSSFVCTLRLCSRLIARMLGAESVERWTEAKLQSPVDANGGREFHQPAILAGPSVMPLKWNGSADIYTLARANALIVRRENAPMLSAGATVQVLEIPS